MTFYCGPPAPIAWGGLGEIQVHEIGTIEDYPSFSLDEHLLSTQLFMPDTATTKMNKTPTLGIHRPVGKMSLEMGHQVPLVVRVITASMLSAPCPGHRSKQFAGTSSAPGLRDGWGMGGIHRRAPCAAWGPGVGVHYLHRSPQAW